MENLQNLLLIPFQQNRPYLILINNLDPGLYNVIKNYENGNTQETLILKENN